MTNQEILGIAMEQSAADLNCKAEDFLKTEPVVVRGGIGPGAKKYYQEPVSANLVSYGNNIVASVKEEYQEVIEEYLHKFTFYHCFETPNIHWLEDKLRKEGQSVCFMAEYYLPDINKVKPLSCEYSLKILHQEDFAELYRPEWS
ncbi:MAG TPA: GNAT family N-acetyltransferase, partial [Candidatus Blautia avicola]|nr:GNAT family N-acetyltransferase [Candidatus Blautia avicola]